MNLKKQLGTIAVVAVTVFGTVAGAGQLASPPPAAKALAADTITLKPGEATDLLAEEPVRAQIEDPEIIKLAPPVPAGAGKSAFHAKAAKVGKTTVTIWSKDGSQQTYTLIVQA